MKLLIPRHRLDIKRRPRAQSAEKSWDCYKFDESTGQVYSETTAAIQSIDDRNWHSRAMTLTNDSCAEIRSWQTSPSSRADRRVHQQSLNCVNSAGRGTRSLQEAAIECILENISDVTLEVLEHLPSTILKKIWHTLSSRGLVCFNIWSIFTSILYHDMDKELLRYQQTIPYPRSPLNVYAKHLTSKSFSFIASLSITVVLPVPDLLKLSNLINLGVLEIVNSTSRVSEKSVLGIGDRLMRAWHFAASDDGAFPVLRILRLWNHEDLTCKSLVYLNSFPALAVYDVRGCGFELNEKIQARQLGWNPIVDTNLLKILEAACAERTLLMEDRLGMKAQSPPTAHTPQSNDNVGVTWLPRNEELDFFVRNIPTMPSKVLVDSRAHSLKAKTLKRKRSRKGASDKTITAGTSSNTSMANDWEQVEMFARVGELRNDADLIKAGIELGDQAAVRSELVSSIPMASLRLGQACPGTSSLRALSFIRIKLPSQASATSHYHNPEAVSAKTEGLTVNRKTFARRHPQGTIVKRRKLGDVLSSFLLCHSVEELPESALLRYRSSGYYHSPGDGGIICTTSTSEIAEHGGLSVDDRKVACFVSNPGLKKTTYDHEVSTKQVAPTILKALGLDPDVLQGAIAEGTHLLDGF